MSHFTLSPNPRTLFTPLTNQRLESIEERGCEQGPCTLAKADALGFPGLGHLLAELSKHGCGWQATYPLLAFGFWPEVMVFEWWESDMTIDSELRLQSIT